MSNTLKIGFAIKNFRKHNNLTLQAFADKLNKALPTVKKYESDDILVPLDTLDDICAILNVTLDQLWFLARLNDDATLKELVSKNLKLLDTDATFTDNDYIIIYPKISRVNLSIALDFTILRQYINTTYCELQPISSLIPEKVIYLAIVKYWQSTVMPQIKKALDQPSQRSIYEQKSCQLQEAARKEVQALELLRNIVVSANNPHNELAHVIPLLEDLNKGIKKIV